MKKIAITTLALVMASAELCADIPQRKPRKPAGKPDLPRCRHRQTDAAGASQHRSPAEPHRSRPEPRSPRWRNHPARAPRDRAPPEQRVAQHLPQEQQPPHDVLSRAALATTLDRPALPGGFLWAQNENRRPEDRPFGSSIWSIRTLPSWRRLALANRRPTRPSWRGCVPARGWRGRLRDRQRAPMRTSRGRLRC